MMTKDGFYRYIQYHIRDELPEEYRTAEITLHEVYKHNDQLLHGLDVRLPGEKTAPLVYLDAYYEAYESGGDLQMILKDVAVKRVEYSALDMETKVTGMLKTLDSAKDHLYVRLCDSHANIKRLENMVWTSEGLPEGIAATLHFSLNDELSTSITPEILRSWGMDTQEVFSAALESMQRQFPVTSELMMDAIQRNMGSVKEDDLLDHPENYAGPELIVISNRKGQFGASSLLYPGVMEKAGEIIGESFYIIPSSLHEVILVPESISPGPKVLTEMLVSTNEGMVSENDRLSDTLLAYDKERGELITVRENDWGISADKEKETEPVDL